MDRVVDDCDHAIITRQGGEPVVMVSLASWKAMDETNNLLSTPENARRLQEGLAQFEAGEAIERALIKP